MTDVSQAIERREGDSLSQILGTGDTRAALERLERNARDIIDLARARGHVRRFGNAQSEHFGLPAWQLLGFTYGLVAKVEWSRPVDNGWEARSVVVTRDGTEVGSAEAMCTRNERNWNGKSDHDVRAMAQTRARRNALRGVLGAFLVLTGFDFADPDAPANDDQVGILHLLERQLGWDHEHGHRMADVKSYRDLTREQAHETIERWSNLVDSGAVAPTTNAGEGGSRPPAGSSPARPGKPVGQPGKLGQPTPAAPDQDTSSAAPGTPEESRDAEATTAGGAATSEHGPSSSTGEGSPGEAPPPVVTLNELWDQYNLVGGTSGRAIKRARERHRDGDPAFPEIVHRSTDLTEAQLQALLDERRA
jgi:hypothetical protein